MNADGTTVFLGDTTEYGWDYQQKAEVHGWCLWAAWSLLGFIQMACNRYFKVFWKINMWVHRIVGTSILVLTIIMSIIGLRNMKYEFSGEVGHYVIGWIIFFGIAFLAGGGIITRSRMNRLKWKTHVILSFKFVHKVSKLIVV